MKKMFSILASILLTGCVSTSTSTALNKTTEQTKIQKKNPEVLLGKHDRTTFQKKPYTAWFTKNFNEYTVDTETITQLKPYIQDVTIKAFMGTWCSDSRRETPSFYKILDATNFDYTNLELVAVSRDKDTPDELEKGLDIIRVPTFIFYKNGEEIGRYVEYPRVSLEKDMLAIISGQTYKHSYEN